MIKIHIFSIWSSLINTLSLIIFSLVAFAANSVLCRLALAEGAIDGGSFTIIRILSGALMLWVLVFTNQKSFTKPQNNASWAGALALFCYCAAFSYAYIHLDTALGALILFGTVQLIIIGTSLFNKDKTPLTTWIGVFAALAGFVYLMLPSDVSETKISALGAVLMMLSGAGWAAYTLLGRKSITPLADSAVHFGKASLVCAPLLLGMLLLNTSTLSVTGVVFAVISGAITSGIGYAVWYKVLPRLSRLQAGVIQLGVPVVAALGGVLFVGEQITTQFIIATTCILGGVFVTLLPQKKSSEQNTSEQ